jgi:hypothetical protein
MIGDAIDKVQVLEGISYKIHRWHFSELGKPSMEVRDGSASYEKKLHWGSHYIKEVSDFIVSSSNFFVIGTSVVGNPRSVDHELVLWLFHFNGETGELIQATEIGLPTFIYNFPGVSNLDLNEDLISVVWNSANDDYTKNTLSIGSYDISSKTFSSRRLPYKSTWNIFISIASIEDVLCIAHHGATKEISVHFEKINSEQGTTPNADKPH